MGGRGPPCLCRNQPKMPESPPDTTPPSNRCYLLELPLEIRNIIYLDLLNWAHQPPSSPQHAGKRQEERHTRDSPDNFSRSVFYATERPKSNGMPLLGLNRQIYDEVSYFLSHHHEGKGKLVHKLDCMIEAAHVWPTWTCIPASALDIRTLEIDFRFFYIWRYINRHNGQGEDNLFARAKTPLCHVLYRLIHDDSPLIPSVPSQGENKIETIIVNLSYHRGPPSDKPLCAKMWRRTDFFETIFPAFERLEKSGFWAGKIKKLIFCFGSEVREVEPKENGSETFRAKRHTAYKDWDAAWKLWSPRAERLPCFFQGCLCSS